jgi:hypothetical protein
MHAIVVLNAKDIDKCIKSIQYSYTHLLSSFSRFLQRPTKSLCKATRKLFRAKAHLPRPELAGKNMAIGVEFVTSMQHVSCEIEKGPIIKEKHELGLFRGDHSCNLVILIMRQISFIMAFHWTSV